MGSVSRDRKEVELWRMVVMRREWRVEGTAVELVELRVQLWSW